VAVFFALALGDGGTATSLRILGPISTFALPAVAVVAFWWNDWPGSRLTVPWTGLVDTLLVAAAAAAIAGQAVVERPDVRAVFQAGQGPGPVTFPATLPLAGAAFAAMLQLSLVCERWPLGGLGRLRSGIAALALSWAIGAGAYFLFVNLDAVPAAERAAAGLRNPGGPIARADFGSALIAVGVWQAVFFIALRGWPVTDPMILPHYSYLLAGLIPQARVKIYPDSAHGFPFQHHVEFAADVTEFLS
jgi:pimeloyl-ACP methyl ester carboxylesterase